MGSLGNPTCEPMGESGADPKKRNGSMTGASGVGLGGSSGPEHAVRSASEADPKPISTILKPRDGPVVRSWRNTPKRTSSLGNREMEFLRSH